MNLSNYVSMLMKRAAISTVMGIMAFALASIACGFFIAAFYIWLSTIFITMVAAALTGAFLLFIALVGMGVGNLILRRLRRRTPHLFAAATQSLGTMINLGGLLMRAGPKRVLLMALVAGAVAEYLGTRNKPD